MNKENKSWVDNKSLEELVWGLGNAAGVGSKMHEEIKGALTVACTKEIKKSIDSFNQSMSSGVKAANRLSNMILALNIVLGIFTVIGAVLTVIQFLDK